MNITLENAVLVKLATKENEEVKKPLGTSTPLHLFYKVLTNIRQNSSQG